MEGLESAGPTPSSLINGSEVSIIYSGWLQIGGFCLGVELAGGDSNWATLLNSLGYTGCINYIDCCILKPNRCSPIQKTIYKFLLRFYEARVSDCNISQQG